MRSRVVLADGAAASVVDLERERGAALERAFLHRAGVHEEIAGLLLGVGDAEAHAVAGYHAGVADLAAGLAIERGLVDDHRAGFALAERSDFPAVLDQRRDHTLGDLGLVAEELGGAELFAQRKPHRLGGGVARALPGFARL